MKKTIANSSVFHSSAKQSAASETGEVERTLKVLKQQAEADALIWQRFEESSKRSHEHSVLRRLLGFKLPF